MTKSSKLQNLPQLSNLENLLFPIIILVMGFFKKVKELFCSFDLFAHKVSFRYKEQPDYQTATGGCISITTFVIFISIFTGTAINTFKRQYIYFSRSQFEETTPSYFNTSADSDFMFAVGIKGLDMNAGPRYFDVSLEARHYSVLGQKKNTVDMQPCHLPQWGNINRQLGKTYDRLNLNKWLCPPAGLVIQLQGKPTSEIYAYYHFTVSKCNPAKYPQRPCVGDSLIQNYINANQTFLFQFYFVNKILNPDNHTFISLFLDDVNTFQFGTVLGVNANIFINAFEIKTDESIWPVQDYSNRKGGLISQKAQTFNYNVVKDTYCKINLRKSSISIKIDRSFRKADDTLSYVGGLFSSIIALLFIMGLYDEFSYEMDMAKAMFHENNGKTINSDTFHIFSFIGYLIFILFTKIHIQLPWPRMKAYHTTLQQVRKQLDIRLILKKVQFNQRVNRAYIEQNKLMLLQLQSPLTIDQCAQHREQYLVYKKIRRHLKDKDVFDINGLEPAMSNDSLHQLNKSQKCLAEIHNDSLVNDAENTIEIDKAREKETEEEKQKRETRQLFRKLKYAMTSLERQIQQSGQDKQLALNLLDKIDKRIVKEFKKIHSKKNYNSKMMSLETGPLQSIAINEGPSFNKKITNQQNLDEEDDD